MRVRCSVRCALPRDVTLAMRFSNGAARYPATYKVLEFGSNRGELRKQSRPPRRPRPCRRRDCVTAETVSPPRPCACSAPLLPALSTRSSVHPTLDPSRALSVPFSARTRLRLRHKVACIRSVVPSSSCRSPQAHAHRLLTSLKPLCC